MSFVNKAAFTITSDSAKLPSTQTNKVVLVNITHASLKTVAHGGEIQNVVSFNGKTVPADAVFKLASDLSGAAMSYDVLFYDQTNGILIANVLKASCSQGSQFYLGIGDVTISTYQGGAVGAAYPSGYLMAWYAGDATTLNLLDSTANAQNGINSGVSAVAGKIKAAGRFNGSSTIDFAQLVDTPVWTIRAWVKPSISGGQYLLGRSSSDALIVPFWMAVNSASGYTRASGTYNFVSDGACGTAAFHRLGFSYDGTSLYYWVDGVLINQVLSPGTPTTSLAHLILGQCGDYVTGGKFSGDAGDLEILNYAAGADEMKADYSSQNDPTATGFFSSVTVTSTGNTGVASSTSTALAVSRSAAAAIGSAGSTSSALAYSTDLFRYVEPISGLDSNSGLIGAPWKTLNYAATHISVGGTIFLRAGDYHETLRLTWTNHPSGTSWDAPITMKAYPGETVRWAGLIYNEEILGFGDNSMPGVPHDYYWIFEGISFRGDRGFDHNRTASIGIAAVGDRTSRYLRFIDCEISWTIADGVLAGESYWELINCNVHDNGSGDGPGDHGIYWGGEFLTIDGGFYWNNSGFGIHIFSSGHNNVDDNIVRNVRSYTNGIGPHAGNSSGGGGILVSCGHRNKVYNCISVYNNLGSGIQIDYRAANSEIYSNTVYGNSENGFKIGSFGAEATATILRNNIAFGNATGGSGNPISDAGIGTIADHNITIDPLFASIPDFTLLPSSPARGAGLDLHSLGIAELDIDILGNPRPNAPWCSGALEFTGSAAAGSASSTSTALAVGASISRAVGTAASTSTAIALTSTNAYVGSAASTSTALAVSTTITNRVGSAAAIADAVAVGRSLAASIGVATSTSLARAGTALTSIQQAILQKILKNIAFAISPIWVSLHSGPVGLNGANEITGGLYHRTPTTAATWSPAASRFISNDSVIQFGTMPVSTVSWVGIWSAEVNGALIGSVGLNYPVAIRSGDTPKFEIGSLLVQFNEDFSTYLANALLNYMFRGTAFTTAPVYWSLHTDIATSFNENAAAQSTEVVGGSYARQAAVIGSWAAAGERLEGDSIFSLDYQALVSFSGMPTVSIKRLALWDAATNGNFLMWGPELPLSVTAGQTVTIDGTIARTLRATLTQTP